MPTSSRSRLASALAVVLAAGALVGCSPSAPSAEPSPRAGVVPGSSDGSSSPGLLAQPDVVKAIGKTLRRRASAVRQGDLSAFIGGVLRDDQALLNQQRTYFANLAQLPLEHFSYAFDRGSLVREGGGYWVVVTLRMQLAGYDDRPVASSDRYRFEPVGKKAARFRLASVDDLGWEVQHDVRPQPWDSGPIVVRSGAGVLGIFDPQSVGQAPSIVSSVEEGIRQVSGSVPYAWSGAVVVYALSTPTFLTSVEDLPGDDPDRLDGVAFPVRARPGGPVASTRFVLHPRMLAQAGPQRDRLVRHELTHVAVGGRDDAAPVWLSEGIAEYVSVRPLAPQDRLISGAALEAAREGIDQLPSDDSFNSDSAAANYALAWWACEYLADTAGPASLWALLEAFDRPDVDQQQELQFRFGVGTKGLARKTSRLIVATFDPPPPSSSPKPSKTPKPSSSPSSSPSGSTSPSPSVGQFR